MTRDDAIVVGAFDAAGDLVSINGARHLLAADGEPLSRDTVRSLFLEGRLGVDGRRYRPACAKLGKRWMTTRRSLNECLARIAGVSALATQHKRTNSQGATRGKLAREHGVLVGVADGAPHLRPGTDDSLRTRTSAPEPLSHRAPRQGGRGVFSGRSVCGA